MNDEHSSEHEESTPPPPSLMDFAGAQPQPEPQPEQPSYSPADAYSDEEVAQLVAAVSCYGLPLDLLDDYQKAFIGRALPIVGLLETGEALAELGIHKGSGVGRAPAWLRCAAAGAGVGFVAFQLRKEFSHKSTSRSNRAAGGGAVDEHEQGPSSHA